MLCEPKVPSEKITSNFAENHIEEGNSFSITVILQYMWQIRDTLFTIPCICGNTFVQLFTDQYPVWQCLLTLCVAGVRKLTFNTPIVTTTENVTRIMVKRRYLPKTNKEKITFSLTFPFHFYPQLEINYSRGYLKENEI